MKIVALVIAFFSFINGMVYAQYNGHHSNGSLGLRAGSQMPPGWAIAQSFGYAHFERIVDRFGNAVQLPGNPKVNSVAVVPSVIWVTQKKIFGANYAVAAAFPFVNSALELDSLDVKGKFGVSDFYLQPINLGWHGKSLDLIAAFGFYIPTGRFYHGQNNNYGLGMWTYELEAAATFYPDRSKMWNIAMAAWYEFNSKKENGGIQVGSIATIEGGIGRNFLRGRMNAGISYASQWKLIKDKTDSSTLPGKNRVFSLGPEVSYLFIKKNRMPWLVITSRWLIDIDGRATIMGNRLKLLVSFPFLDKPAKR